MLIRSLVFLILGSIFAPSVGHADFVAVQFFVHGYWFPVGGEPGYKGIDGERLEVSYLWGEKHGPLLGVGYARDDFEFTHCSAPNAPCDKEHETEMEYPTLVTGYYLKNKNMTSWGFLNIGYGTFKIQDQQHLLPAHKDRAVVVDLGFKWATLFKVNNLDIRFIGGIGLLNPILSIFSYNGERFERTDIQRPYVIFGTGAEF